jgi:hypothetical protein
MRARVTVSQMNVAGNRGAHGFGHHHSEFQEQLGHDQIVLPTASAAVLCDWGETSWMWDCDRIYQTNQMGGRRSTPDNGLN